jgi:threonine dehydrogenase-like Zn-dependent dehydrogenase
MSEAFQSGRYSSGGPPRACIIGAGPSGIAAAMRTRYFASKRHTIQVDFDEYLHALAKERRAGAERARTNGLSGAACRPSAATTAS